MARNGTGTYDLPEAPFVYDTVISETAVNSNFSDIASALTQSLSKDGQTTPTANLPMGNFRHTGVGNGTARNHYGSVGQIQDDSVVWCGTAGGTANALTLTPSPSITAYATGQRFRFQAGASPSDDAATIAVSGLTAKAAEINDAALSGSVFIEAGKYYECFYDGTAFQLSRLSTFVPTFGTAALLDAGTSENNLVQLGAGGAMPAVGKGAMTGFGTAAEEDVAAGGTGDLLRSDGDGSNLTGITTGPGELVHVRELQAGATSGGTFTTGAWQTRALNTVVTNEVSGASLGSSQITLPAGTYVAEAYGTAHQVDTHVLRLQDTTNTATLGTGAAGYAGVNSVNTLSKLYAKFTLAGTAVLELQHRCGTTRATDGFGLQFGTSFADKIYSEIRIWKI